MIQKMSNDVIRTPQVAGSTSEFTILLVDDQPAVRFGLQLLFQLEARPLRVCEAGSSAEALAIVEREHPDVIIMDVDLPDRDGINATRQITKLLPGCLIIVHTIHGRPEVRSNAFEAGAWAFVEKGTPDAIRTALHQAIRRLEGERRTFF